MLRPLLLLLLALPAQAETRCGWYQNPSPGNVILEDAHGQWWISRQDSAPAPGFEDAYTTAFDDRLRLDYDGKRTDGYGHSCVCAEGVFDGSALLHEPPHDLPTDRNPASALPA